MAGEPNWVRKAPKQSRVKPVVAALGEVSWMSLFCALLAFAGVGEGIIAVVYSSWYALGLGLICEFAALNFFLLSSREDR